MEQNKKPEMQREQRRLNELKNNPMGTLKDGVERGSSGSFHDCVGGVSWKMTGVIILVLIFIFVVGTFLMK